MELLIRVKDKINLDSVELDALLTKRGDVIAIRPDGHRWGTKELSNPEWRIIHIPSLTERQAQELLEEEPVDQKNRQKRVRKIDIDDLSLSKRSKDFISDDTRATIKISDDTLVTKIITKTSREEDLLVIVDLEL